MIRPISSLGLDLIRSFEGLEDGDPTTVNLDPYLDPVGIWTIGWGHAIRWNGRLLRGRDDAARAKALYPDGLTPDQANLLLRGDVLDTCRDVQALVTVPITDPQFDALVSFAYNCGTGALKRSTLLKLLLAGKVNAAADEFLKWTKAGGQVLPGLVRRRQAERDRFLTPL